VCMCVRLTIVIMTVERKFLILSDNSVVERRINKMGCLSNEDKHLLSEKITRFSLAF
jgi:hypothetical protein